MVLPDGRLGSCGNFHGALVALAADYFAIAAAEFGAIAERHSGLMIGQYTAAALCTENRRFAALASVDSLPNSAMQEDHVSVGWGVRGGHSRSAQPAAQRSARPRQARAASRTRRRSLRNDRRCRSLRRFRDAG